MSVKTYIIISDLHIPSHNERALHCVSQAIKIIKPDGFIINGDLMDCATFSRHDRFSAPKCHWTDTQFYDNSWRDYTITNHILDDFDALLPVGCKKQFIYGNHEMWVEDFVAEAKTTRQDLFSIRKRLDLVERGYKITKFNDFISIGKLQITHGLYTCQNHAKKHLQEMGSSILYGHLHNIEVASKTTPAQVSHMAWASGCLCDLNPAYLRNRPQNWNHGFAIVYVWPRGEFQVDLIRIQNGKCIIHGKEITR